MSMKNILFQRTVQLLFLLLLLKVHKCTELPEAEMTVSEIIQHYGYPVEEHTVITEDGYHLLIHRIPCSKKDRGNEGYTSKPVVFLQHGFVGSSALWVTNLPSQSAGFLFADAGFDVWMGNFRGNTYSLKHELYDQDDPKFWKFSFDEYSKYDTEAMINKALNITGQSKLYYVGYSEGTLVMFAKLSSDPAFSKKLHKVFALAPMRKMEHFLKGFSRILGHYVRYVMRPIVLLYQNSKGFLPSFGFVRKLNRFVCGIPYMASICDLLIYQSSGDKPTMQINQTRIPVYAHHFPAGCSWTNALHWLQVILSKDVRMYDFGTPEFNVQHYGTEVPPTYNFRKISAPLYLYWSDADWLTDKNDVKEGLLDQVPPEFIVENNLVKDFNHFDFIWGSRAVSEVYRPIIRTISSSFYPVELASKNCLA